MDNWKFYGRDAELTQLETILKRDRFSFVKVSGRRRIGKTTLIREAIQRFPNRTTFYVQIPDADPAGVLAEIRGFMETMGLDRPSPQNFTEFGQLLADLLAEGAIVVLDEFQYFHRKVLMPFTSSLQAVVDECIRRPSEYPGCLIVLGSIHTEMNALLEDRHAPLFQRTTDSMALTHLEVRSVAEILAHHGAGTPEALLFYWNLFEGVPKFYRDCYEQGVFQLERKEVLEKMFFGSSSPLKNEAENWFLQEVRGRYSMALKFIAEHPGCSSGDIKEALNAHQKGSDFQISGHLNMLVDKYAMVEKRLPIFARHNSRSGRFYISDNFLRSWMHALKQPVASVQFRPVSELVERANEKLIDSEGFGLEKLVGALYQERSKRGVEGFPLTQRIEGYWDRSDIEIDFIAFNDEVQRIRFGTCKRSAAKVSRGELAGFKEQVQKFLSLKPSLASWNIEYTAITVAHTAESRKVCAAHGVLAEDLESLIVP